LRTVRAPDALAADRGKEGWPRWDRFTAQFDEPQVILGSHTRILGIGPDVTCDRAGRCSVNEWQQQPAESTPLSAKDYLSALLQEHEHARDEIKSKVTARNAGIVTLAAAIITAFAKAFPFKSNEASHPSARLLAFLILPALWFAISILQATRSQRSPIP
jgi:hypothetical protein